MKEIETLYAIYLVAIFAIFVIAIFLGRFYEKHRLDDDPSDSEALNRISEAKREQKELPVFLRKQCD